MQDSDGFPNRFRRSKKGSESLGLYTKSNSFGVGPKSSGPKSARTLGMSQTSMESQIPTVEKPFESLYERTMSLLAKLYSIPDFEFYLFPDGLDALINGDAPPVIDPIALLWHCFRLGAPLCHLMNQIRPKKLLAIPDVSHLVSYTNVCKKCVFHFLIAVKEELGIADDRVFTISELYEDDMNKLVKVLNTVDYVLMKLENDGRMPPLKVLPFSTSISKIDASDNRSRSISELLMTERKYVEAMSDLLSYQEQLRKSNTITNDMIHQIFANLAELLDFQRRFLFSLEATLALPWEEQNIGAIFIQYEEGFSVYDTICANYNLANKVILENLSLLEGVGSIDPKALQGYLIKPIQRICRYPLILKEIIKFSKKEEFKYYDELLEAKEAVERVTERVNEVQRAEDNRELKKDLLERIEDTKVLHINKGLRPNEWGDLLLYDKFPISVQDREKLYHIYLFEQVLLCCKDSEKEIRKSRTSVKSEPNNTQYEIKGKIFAKSIVDAREEIDSAIGFFSLEIFWENGNQSFVLKCRNEEQTRLWKNRVLLCARRESTADGKSTFERDSFSSPRPVGQNVPLYNQNRRPSLGKNLGEVPPWSKSMHHRSLSAGLPVADIASFQFSTDMYPHPPDSSLAKPPGSQGPPNAPLPDFPSRSPPPREPPTYSGPPKSPLPNVPSGPPKSALPAVPSGPSGPPKSALPEPPGADPFTPLSPSSRSSRPPPSSSLPTPPNMNNPPAALLPQPPSSPKQSSGSRPSKSSSRGSTLIKLKTRYKDDIFILALPSQGCSFEEILDKIERKIRICGAEMPEGRRIKLRYKDEEGDFITINSNEDVEMAFEIARKTSDRGTVDFSAI